MGDGGSATILGAVRDGRDDAQRAAEDRFKRAEIDTRQVRIVALDLQTSWSLANADDEFTGRMLAAVNSMLLDMLAAIARKD